MHRERPDDPGDAGQTRRLASTSFGEGVVIYDPGVEGAWIESDTAVDAGECR